MQFHQSICCAMILTSLLACPLRTEGQERRRFRSPVQSAVVDADRKVTFRVRAENADAVRLVSSDLGSVARGQSMKEGEEGVWELTVGPVDPGCYRYRFNIDGVNINDPSNGSVSQSNGTTWSMLYVPGAAWMDTRAVSHGAVAEVTYYSKSLKRFRRMHVYTPPGYEAEGEKRYPVFYLLHGASDCDDSWTTVGRAGFILDNLIAAGNAAPMIVVMPAGHTGPFRFGGRRERPRVDEFIQDFEGDIVPTVEANYRVKNDRANRAIAGLSMGGAQTLNIAMRNLDRYAYVGVFSSGVFGIEGRGRGQNRGPSWEAQHAKALDAQQLKDGLKLVWFATGKDDFLLRTSQATVDMLKKHQFDVAYKETEGGHTWTNWREYLHEFSQYLFRDNVKPVPLK